MKKLYFIVSYSGTWLSKIVKMYTLNNYSHVSIALDKELKEMYSFGRLNPYNPVIGGLVHESPKNGTFKRFKNTICEIYEVEVTDDQYRAAKYNIESMYKERKKYRFNAIGLFAVSLHLKVRRKYYLYCAEFVKLILDKSKIEYNLPELIKPEDFTKIENSKLIYDGLLREYEDAQ